MAEVVEIPAPITARDGVDDGGIRHELDLYRRFVGARVRGQMQYKASFALQIFGGFAGSGLELVGLVFTFARFRSLAGWSLGEVPLLYALASISFGIQEMILRQGFDEMSTYVRLGTFDRVLLRPVTPFTQMLAADFQMRRLGRALQGVVALGVAVTQTHLVWTWGKFLFFPITIASSVLLFAAITVLGATLCFWTIERTEVINVFTYGGTYMASYPISILQNWLRQIVTFVVPLAFVAYYPGLYFLDRRDPFGVPPQVSFLAPVVSVVFFAVRVARLGVGRAALPEHRELSKGGRSAKPGK